VPPLKRITPVFDCWFESGSMPYAQSHYPFAFPDPKAFETRFPADFIAEGLDQTRGWFYTMLVLGTALFDKAPFKNVIVNGLVLAADGSKMSKSKKNYPPVEDILNTCGADALRLFLINSPVVRAEPLRFREEGVKEVVRDVFLPLVNAFKFFVQNANARLRRGKNDLSLAAPPSTNVMDIWIVAATQTLVGYFHDEMKGYRLYTVLPGVMRFLEVLTNWYVRMNRRRLKGYGNTAEEEADQVASLNTLLYVLFAAVRVLAPLTPFLAETLYQLIKPVLPADQQEDSIHYLMLPAKDTSRLDAKVERSMNRLMAIIELVRVMRDR
jgi:isoleucyl-tRNA synthetase